MIADIIDQVSSLWRTFVRFLTALLRRCKIVGCVTKLATTDDDDDAHHIIELSTATSDEERTSTETCSICLEDTAASNIHAVERCEHRFCVSCMKEHVKRKLLDGTLPCCPQQGCATQLTVGGSRGLMSPELRRIMAERVREGRIPAGKRVYCPEPKCSALMSMGEDQLGVEAAMMGREPYYSLGGDDAALLRKQCVRCGGAFCVRCRVPWHDGMSCIGDRLRRARLNDEKIQFEMFAQRRSWRQCARCTHVIELETGCYHMTCV
ncbi:hypothetical protein PR202_ga04499 [Eleusine coracana subsp. coracana]|uniref:RBR-type E3 ubiquitin transferase n=1 Tax=Eleusine coracana subsp. coracana TaxID=191504 RepID=A0AAV5BPU2_ELECO|nr:hypothetical protein PR202_ga04499 [Eleusine coracana subsp. coracana]